MTERIPLLFPKAADVDLDLERGILRLADDRALPTLLVADVVLRREAQRFTLARIT